MELTSAKRRVLERLKRRDHATVAELARALDLTDMAIRLHLRELADVDWVEKVEPPADGSRGGGRGRPAQRWRLTAAADAQFEDRHADLTLDLIAAIRHAVGEDGLDRVLAARADRQVEVYRRRIHEDDAEPDLEQRLRALAASRSEEGYQAEVVADGDAWLLVEHHCPICDAAKACAGLCRSELDVFRRSLGEDVTVERDKHLLSGDRRCTYRVTTAVKSRARDATGVSAD